MAGRHPGTRVPAAPGVRAVGSLLPLLLPVLLLAVVLLAAAPVAAGATTTTGRVVGEGLSRPEALTLDGGLLVTDTFMNRVVRFEGGSTQPVFVLGGLGPYPAGVARDAAGRIYVADSYYHRILRLDPQASAPVVIAGSTQVPGVSGTGALGLNTPTKLSLAADGSLFVTDSLNHRVLRYQGVAGATGPLPGTVIAGTGVSGTGLGQLSLPVGLDVTDDGTLYVADQFNNRILRYTGALTTSAPLTGTRVAGAASNQSGSGTGFLNRPVGVSVDDDGAVYVADSQNHRIVRWDPGATAGVVVAGGTRGTGPDQFDQPMDVVAQGGGRFTVADRNNGRVLAFGPRLSVLSESQYVPLMTALGGATSIDVLDAGSPSLAVPGCVSGTVQTPDDPGGLLDLLAGDPYLSGGLPVAAPDPSCRPQAVTTTR